MNKLGVHAFVWTADWTNDDAERAIALTAEAGYDLIEVSAMDFSKFDVAFTQKALAKAGIGVTMSFGLDGSQDVSSDDPDRVRAGEQRLEDGLAIARDLGATHVCGILYSAFQKYAVAPTATGVAAAVDVVRRVGEKAASSGIVLGMEVVNRYESNVLNTASQAVSFVRRVGLENVKVHLDCYHMNIEESDVAAAIRQTGSNLGYFHTGDSHRGYLGSGSIAFPPIFRALAEIDYQGPLTFESFSSKVVGQPLEGILGIWRNLWEDSKDLAAHARAFTDVHLKSAREALANQERSTLP
jgi:D-psicose/D-tagatose/L-ribulose 3-epimerase